MTDEIKNLSKEIAKELSEPERGDMPPDGDWPRQDYIGNTSVNKGEKGIDEPSGSRKTRNLYIGGGDNNINLGIKPLTDTIYPNCSVSETISGHVQEIDDTPGRERMIFKHRTGAGIDMRPDGSIIIATKTNRTR